MRNMFSKPILTLLLASVLALSATTGSQAAFQITITAAGGSSGTLTVVDNDANDLNAFANGITFIGNIGGYALTITASQDAPTGTLGTGTLNFNVISVRTQAVTGTLTIVAQSTAFTFLSGVPGLGTNALSNSSLPASSHTGVTVYNDGMNPPITSPMVTLSTSPASGFSTFVTPPGTGTFTLTGTMVINNQGIGTVNATLSSSITALPVPPAIALLASAAPVGLLALRRRRKTVA